jgi:hypothetical protein
MGTAAQQAEWLKCRASAAYFIDRYCKIYDKVSQQWIPFNLWQAQYWTLKEMSDHLKVVALKARQEGLSWLALAYHALYKSIFRPIAKCGIFSKRDDEAVYLLGAERLKGMYVRLPPFLQAAKIEKSDGHIFSLSNGSVVRAYPTTGGDSYALTDLILDEFDLVPDQDVLLGAVLPTVDGGGAVTAISRVDKSRPETAFKRIYRGASRHVRIVSPTPALPRSNGGGGLTRNITEGDGNGWAAVFLPWYAHPARDAAWYEATKREIVERSGTVDGMWEQYPATDDEALAERSLDKRIPAQWLARCFEPLEATPVEQVKGAPSYPQLELYRAPSAGREYTVGVDPAEGNPTSDPSALAVLDAATGEEMCALTGQFQPSTLAAMAATLARWYNWAKVLPERNNHGHSVILWLADNAQDVMVLRGEDEKPGWMSSSRGNTLLYDACADAFRDRDTLLHSRETFHQLSSVEGSTLAAPEGRHDDRADAYALALKARTLSGPPAAGVNVEIGAAELRRPRQRMMWNVRRET